MIYRITTAWLFALWLFAVGIFNIQACSVPAGLKNYITSEKNTASITKKIRALSVTECRLLKTIGIWKDLDERKDVTFEEIADFYQKNPNWPNKIAMRRRAEDNIHDSTSKAALRTWFESNPPLTARGLLWYARVMPPTSKRNVETLKDAFFKIALSEDDLVELKTLTQNVLTPTDYNLCFDQRMQKNDSGGAKLLLSFVSPSYKSIAQDRLTLDKAAQNQNTSIARASHTLAGYLWQYGVYLLKTHQNNALQAFLKDPAVKGAESSQSELWWTSIRRIFIRRLMESGKHNDALAIAINTPSKTGSSYSEALWLRGWLRMKFLNDVKNARTDFEKLYEQGKEFVNLSKAAYWAARACKSCDKKMHNTWLERAAQYRNDFYGQLAMSHLGRRISQKDFVVSAKENASFNNMELVRVIRLFKKIGIPKLSHLFFWKLAIHLKRPDEHTLLIKLASDVGGAYPAVQVTKIGSKYVVPLMRESYPQVEKSNMPHIAKAFGVNMKALVHGIIRQESRFDARATSHMGAKGVMQVVDPTAKDVSRKYGITYTSLYDVKDNIRLGQQYIQELLERYNGSLILAIAAYNAGPGRVDKWVKQMGYPKTVGTSRAGKIDDLDAIEWIQMIPFRETRFYVEHVLENYWCYAVALDGVPIANWLKVLR